ncbi:MAG: hypothetical protein IJH63_08425 [Methanobrevibacter sp.]|uniref:Uncharacterized protein n=1 Tax=Methanobrevibacter millerae TaxID=230361 RepID=A0A8T3VAZ7_9EURY|nr:hypothetical protein [Methanobrevibacter millerae]MBE6504897.1 hypothetical protein [Methanobrevibacter millerae]MBR0370725.1 hypothetical protein [Methanobrevibacter sp.]
MDNDLIDVLNEFRNLKINYDIERFKLLSLQLENILKDYQSLMETRKEIQEKYFEIMENLNKNGLKTEIDYSRWDKLRLNENSEWKFELDELTSLKYEIDGGLELLENGEIEKMIIEEEEALTGTKLRR